MRDAADYLGHVKALIALKPQIVHWQVVREEAQGDIGLLRYRLVLRDDSLLEVFEFFRVVEGSLNVMKYSFHWQDGDGKLRKRWDNAAHYPKVSTHPDHVHDGVEGNVEPHQPVCLESVLALVVAGSL